MTSPRLLWTLQRCAVLSNTVITCASPPSGQSQQTSVLFFLNGVLYTGDRPSFSDYEGEEEDGEPHQGHFLLEYVEDPQFFTANKEKLIKHHPGEQLTLIINVSETAETGCSDSLIGRLLIRRACFPANVQHDEEPAVLTWR